MLIVSNLHFRPARGEYGKRHQFPSSRWGIVFLEAALREFSSVGLAICDTARKPIVDFGLDPAASPKA